MNKDLQKKLSCLESMIATQKDCMNGCGDAMSYMHGMANGMILAHAIFADNSPKFISRPKRPCGRIVRHKNAKSKRKR